VIGAEKVPGKQATSWCFWLIGVAVVNDHECSGKGPKPLRTIARAMSRADK
jgi:hypothetical protein